MESKMRFLIPDLLELARGTWDRRTRNTFGTTSRSRDKVEQKTGLSSTFTLETASRITYFSKQIRLPVTCMSSSVISSHENYGREQNKGVGKKAEKKCWSKTRKMIHSMSRNAEHHPFKSLQFPLCSSQSCSTFCGIPPRSWIRKVTKKVSPGAKS